MLELYTKPIISEPLGSEAQASVYLIFPEWFLCVGTLRNRKSEMKLIIKLNVKNSSKEGCRKNNH